MEEGGRRRKREEGGGRMIWLNIYFLVVEEFK